MRLGLGCMRLSTEVERDPAQALATLDAAVAAGISLLDTARAYGQDERDLGHNERLIARALGPTHGARVVTKCGMRREGAAWLPDGRAKSIAADVEASVAALGEVRIDTLLLHAPDPRTPLATTARALARAAEKAGIPKVGVSNVSRKQLEEVAQQLPVAAVEVALGAYDDLAIRGGVVSYCLAHGIEVLAHAPLGGARRVSRLAKDSVLGSLARAREDATAIELFLAWLLLLPVGIVPIVGARRPETVASFVRASELVLTEGEIARLDERFPVLASVRRPRPAPSTGAPARGADVVLMMGVPGAGKSRAAEALAARGYERLNRDSLGGTLRGIARRLDERLAAGAERLVLDNTYVGRATRSDVLRVAHARGAAVRCIFFDTPAADAQVNIVLRMLERFGTVLEPEELARRSREDPAALAPHALYRMTRDLEPPAPDEGFASIETVAFTRHHGSAAGRPGLAVSMDAPEAELARIVERADADTACLLFGWRPGIDDVSREELGARASRLEKSTGRTVDVALCTHPAGPPICWCRPPLPAMWLGFARRRGIDPRRSTLHGKSSADAALARACGMSYVALDR